MHRDESDPVVFITTCITLYNTENKLLGCYNTRWGEEKEHNYTSVVPNMTSIYTEEVNISGEADGEAEMEWWAFNWMSETSIAENIHLLQPRPLAQAHHMTVNAALMTLQTWWE